MSARILLASTRQAETAAVGAYCETTCRLASDEPLSHIIVVAETAQAGAVISSSLVATFTTMGNHP